MATYAIGDIHGCYDELQHLLEKINFDPKQDTLWFTGDLINGGPKPAETLRFIQALGPKCKTVLGNHDLVLLGVAAGKIPAPKDRGVGMEPVLEAHDCDALLSWLSRQPLVHYDPQFNTLLVHAGVLAQWDLVTILRLANEVETMIQGPSAIEFYSHMYGNHPDTWDENLSGYNRLRFIFNCFTRMRFSNSKGQLELTTKGNETSGPDGFMPWFKVPNRKTAGMKIIFGHWAALMGNTESDMIHGIDTGCVWGHYLTALRLDDWQKFTYPAQHNQV